VASKLHTVCSLRRASSCHPRARAAARESLEVSTAQVPRKTNHVLSDNNTNGDHLRNYRKIIPCIQNRAPFHKSPGPTDQCKYFDVMQRNVVGSGCSSAAGPGAISPLTGRDAQHQDIFIRGVEIVPLSPRCHRCQLRLQRMISNVDKLISFRIRIISSHKTWSTVSHAND